MVIRMGSIEVKDDRNVVLGEVVVIRAIVKSIGVIFIVVRVVELHVRGIGFSHFFRKVMQLLRQFIRTD